MKKVFQIMLLAALALPLMLSCKGKNVPDDPQEPKDSIPAVDVPGTEEWFEDQTTPNDTFKVEIDAKNFFGLWELYASTIKTDAVAPHMTEVRDEENPNGDYFEFKENKTYTWYQRLTYGGWNFTSGTWEVRRDILNLKSNDPNQAPFSTCDEYGDYKVVVLETERMVLASEMLRTGDQITYKYLFFRRIEKLPEIKRDAKEIFLLNPWKVASSVKYTVDNGEVIATKKDLLPQGSSLSFKEDDKSEMYMTVRNSKGEETGKYKCSLFNLTEEKLHFWIYKANADGTIALPDESDAFPNTLAFYPDSTNIAKAKLTVKLDENNTPEWDWEKDKTVYTIYKYELEAVTE